jgi:hypothetical protein
MTDIYQLTPEWEYNGPDDSDFYVVAYDASKDQIYKHCTYTTRFYCSKSDDLKSPTDEVKKRSLELLKDLYRKALLEQVNNPYSFVPGEKVKLDKAVRVKEQIVCEKCDKGFWKPGRPCFACNGQGYRTGEFLKIEPGIFDFIKLTEQSVRHRKIVHAWINNEFTYRVPAHNVSRANDINIDSIVDKIKENRFYFPFSSNQNSFKDELIGLIKRSV